ncbi:hypothetical protein [Aquitalea magnusonii]|uniref:hypothetical protein n=1 Tax=Aquitalea magnusonii TaxID=332411 RepID=UPI000E65C39A|nr:hypothetical protein [Aquitalea magnusonii]
MTKQVELDESTKAKLRAEVDLLVSMGHDRARAKRIVWDDYLDELAAYTAAAQPVATPPETEPVQEQEIALPAPTAPDPVLPGPEPPARTSRFWDAKEEPRLTPEWLERNRLQLAKVKQIVGMRSR